MKIIKNLDLDTNTFMFSVLFENVNLIEFQKILTVNWLNFIYENQLEDIVMDRFEKIVFENSIQINLFFTSIDEINDYDLKLINFLKDELLHD